MKNQQENNKKQKKSEAKVRQQADPARLAAFHVLQAVYANQAFSNLSSIRLLDDERLSALDRAFASAMIYGTVSRTISIDWLLTQVSTRKIAQLDLAVLSILRLGVYQLYWSRSVPESAAVNESVKLARQVGQARAAGFINAVLRSLTREKPSLPENKPPVLYSLPPALYGYLKKWYGSQAPALAQSFLDDKKDITLRVNRCQTTPAALFNKLNEQGYIVQPGLYCEEALRLEMAGTAVNKLCGWQSGDFMIQDEAAMLAALACDPKPGQVIYDLCAAPGGKSAHIAEISDRGASQIALDINLSRLRLMQENFLRLGHTHIDCLPGDATGAADKNNANTTINTNPANDVLVTDTVSIAGFGNAISTHETAAVTVNTSVLSENKQEKKYPTQLEEASADLVLLDAPCSGLGLLARKPELRLTMTHEKMLALYPLQQNMLDYAAKLVNPGGILVYSTCTINPDENINAIRAFINRHQDQFAFDPLSSLLPDKLLKDEALAQQAAEGWIQLLPHCHGTDGFFIARLRKK